ncbi:MAG: DUF2723 domain-containing protein [Gemmatimonadaceae bacterium]
MPPKNTDLDYRPSYLAATLTSLAVFALYCATLAPSTAMWDTSEYIAAAYVLGIPHPPGNPLFVLIGHVFAILPIGMSVAKKINILAALTSAVAAGMWFLITERILVGWLLDRWQRILGGVLAALIGATAFTVWNQSVVNEKVYTVSLMGLAIISWLTVRWSDDPDGPYADRLLVLIAYLLGLGYANHMMGFLAGPAVVVAVVVRRPATLMRWKLIAVSIGALLLGMTPFLTQPIRASHFPAINEGEPTNWNAFLYNFNRGQYGKPAILDRQAPFIDGQLGMYWLYFRWQWLRDVKDQWPRMQQSIAAVYMLLGLMGGWVHFKRDRKSFWYFGTFMLTLTVILIYYLNFKYGHSQCLALGNPSDINCEVRDRDYFFIVAFSAWGVWTALGLVYIWEGVASLFGSEQVKIGRETMEVPRRQSWIFGSWILLFALFPLFANWRAASRAGQTDTFAFAHDLLDSVEPYGILITAGDNDTFPLWYAQEVEGVRKDVLVLCTSLLNTDWYVRQLVRRPVYPYDAAKGPAVYRGREWPMPKGPPLHMTTTQADSIPEYQEVREPMLFKKGSIEASIKPQVLAKADIVVLLMIKDDYPARPMYFSRTAGGYPQDVLGLGQYLLMQGLARKLLPTPPVPGKDTVLLQGEGFVDVTRTHDLWHNDFTGPAAVIKRGLWVDKASVGIPYIYITTAVDLADIAAQRGDSAESRKLMETARKLADATDLSRLFATQPPPTAPAVPLGVDSGSGVKMTDTGTHPRK